MARWNRRKKVEFLVGGALLLITSLGGVSGWMNPLEYLFLDLHFKLRPARVFPEQVAVIGVDETSLDALGQWPWPRDHHASLIGLLRYAPFRPKVVGYDLLFESRSGSNPPGDLSLVYQVRSFPNAFVTAYFFEKSESGIVEMHPEESRLNSFALPESTSLPEALDTAQRASLPYSDLAGASDLAFVNTPMDLDGKTRHAQLLVRYHDRVYPSMDLLLALHAVDAKLEDVRVKPRRVIIEKSRIGRIEIPVNRQGEMLINFYSNSRNIQAYSFVQILNAGKEWMAGGESPDILQKLKDKVVVIGVTALGLGDRRVTPMARYETGVSLHAQAIANILERRFLQSPPPWAAFAGWLAAGILTLFMTLSWHIKKALPGVLIFAAGYSILVHAAFRAGIWFPLAGPLSMTLAVFIGVTCFRYFTALEELKRTQSQLIQSAKMAALGELSSGMAHEFRNILHAITLHVDYAARPSSTPERARQSIEKVQHVLANASSILNGLLTFARKNEARRVTGNLKKTILSTLVILEKDLNVQRIEVVQEFEDLPDFSFDPGQISQVIMNLIRNSRDVLMTRPGERKILLRMKREAGGVRLEIEDNGPGLPDHVKKNLFQPFITTKPEGQGTGLGLSVCHGIIKNHEGEITARSLKGQGTVWSIFLPASFKS